ncbi:MAG: WHG domain-containing protein [Myxococcota bacterium]
MTRQQVIDTAVGCVERDGADALRVSRVAAALGIKPPSLYNHIGKGDALALAVAIEGNRQMVTVMKGAARGIIDPHAQLMAMALAGHGWATTHDGLYTVMNRVPPENDHPDFAPVLQDLIDLFHRPLLRIGVSSGGVIHAIRAFRAAMHGFIILENAGQFALEQDPQESYQRLMRWLLHGMSSPS